MASENAFRKVDAQWGSEINSLLKDNNLGHGEGAGRVSSSSDIKILLYTLQSLWAVIEMTAMLRGDVRSPPEQILTVP